jgi:glycosyltransferase involved in cell wall biosynthesis
MIFRHADALIANTDAVAHVWRGRYPRYQAKIHVIWNGYDPNDAVSAGPLPSQGRRVLAHVGSIYGDRNPGLILHSLHRLIRSGRLDHAGIQVRLLGFSNGAFRAAEPQLCDELAALGCLDFPGRAVPREQALRVQAEADYLLLLDVLGSGGGLQVPGKLFEYVRIGRPVLACTRIDSPVARLLDQSGISHVLLHPEDAQQTLDEKVLRFFSLPSGPQPLAASFARQFNGESQTGALAAILDRLSAAF